MSETKVKSLLESPVKVVNVGLEGFSKVIELKDFPAKDFDKKMKQQGLGKTEISEETVRKTKIRYTLVEGITVQGSWDKMEELVHPKREGGSWLVRIRTAKEPVKDYV